MGVMKLALVAMGGLYLYATGAYAGSSNVAPDAATPVIEVAS